MNNKISLKIIIDALEAVSEENLAYFDLEQNETVFLPTDITSVIGNRVDDIPAWMIELKKLDDLVKENYTRFILLPTQYDIHEHAIMEQFISVSIGEHLRDVFYRAIYQKGAFRHFKVLLNKHHLEQMYFDFYYQALIKIASTWCDAYQIKYTDLPSMRRIL